ncbi:MAG: hypothetical protein NTW28_19390 [Candidatus Solibacter sp.]|nr:hypothetical protein [Candidatus Solibacter sp.]
MDAQLAARVQSLRARFDVWGTGERNEGFVAPTGKREELDSVDRFEFGVRVSQGFELGAEIHARSQKDAEKLVASMESLKAMMNGGEQAGPRIDVHVKDGTVKLSLAISEEELKNAMAAQQGERAPVGGPPTIVSLESTTPAPTTRPDSRSVGTSVFVLPGKK